MAIYKANYPGGTFVSTQPINARSAIMPGQTYAPPPGYRAAGPQPVNGATFRNYLQAVAGGRYFAGFDAYVGGTGVIKR
jgi:hypothetical protein